MKPLATGLVMAASLALAAPSAIAQPAELPELKIALAIADSNVNPTTASVFRLAEALGLYEKHGVKLTVVALEGTPQAVAALNSGAVDIADINIDAAIRLRADNNVPVRGFLAIAQGAIFLTAAKSDVAGAEDLAGRSFAIADNGSLDHNLTVAMLRGKGAAEPNFVAVGSPDIRIQALAAGRVDATTVSFGTYLSIADAGGIHVIVQPEEMGQYTPSPTKFIAALDGTLETKRDAVQRFTNALMDAARILKDDPQGWVDAMAKARDDLPRERLEAISGFINGSWCTDGCMDADRLAEVEAFIYANPDFKDVGRISVADVVDRSFTEQANQLLGPYHPKAD